MGEIFPSISYYFTDHLQQGERGNYPLGEKSELDTNQSVSCRGLDPIH